MPGYTVDNKMVLSAFDFLDKNHGCVVGGEPGPLIFLYDRQSWIRQELPEDVVIMKDILSSVQYINDTCIWVSGSDNVILRYNGHSWIRVPYNYGNLHGGYFWDENHGYIYGSGLIITKADFTGYEFTSAKRSMLLKKGFSSARIAVSGNRLDLSTLGINGKYTYRIFSITGKTVARKSTELMTIDVKDLTTGMYLLEVTNNAIRCTLKFLKK